jgi:hypothetical protein
MSDDAKPPDAYTPPADRKERIRDMDLSPQQFAAKTGASFGFNPPHPHEWALFWQTDICEKDQFHTAFPALGLAGGQAVWLAMEKHFFAKYQFFLRVWPEWGSSGIWLIPYPGSRLSGPNLSDYDSLGLSPELQRRFTEWQDQYWDAAPWEAEDKFDYEGHHKVATELASDLKKEVGESIYVECEELLEVLCDGTTLSCKPRLGVAE